MSFSGTPLGQGRRLDHSTFLGKPTSSGNAAPASFAYGSVTFFWSFNNYFHSWHLLYTMPQTAHRLWARDLQAVPKSSLHPQNQTSGASKTHLSILQPHSTKLPQTWILLTLTPTIPGFQHLVISTYLAVPQLNMRQQPQLLLTENTSLPLPQIDLEELRLLHENHHQRPLQSVTYLIPKGKMTDEVEVRSKESLI